MTTRDDLLKLMEERREATKNQSGWYSVKYEEYRRLLDILDQIVKELWDRGQQ